MTLEDVVRRALSLEPHAPVSDADGPGVLPGWDSLGHVRVLAAVEESFGIRLDVREVGKVRTVADIRALLKARGIEGSR